MNLAVDIFDAFVDCFSRLKEEIAFVWLKLAQSTPNSLAHAAQTPLTRD